MSPHDLVDPVSIVSRDVGSQHSRVDRGLCTTVSMLCMFWLAFIFGSRAKRLHLNNLAPINWIRLIIILLYIFAICFVFTAAILTSGLGLTSNRDCFTAVFTCLVFYFGNKMIMYMFLIERAHIIRAPYERRIHDKAWVACMSFLIVGFGAIAVIAFVWPNAEVSTRDGKCRIGQPLKVTIPLLTYDIVVNVSLTALFVHFLYPFLAPKGNRISLGQSLSSFRFGSQQRKSPNCSPNQDRVTGRLRRLVVKTVVGGVLVMIPTVANLTGVLITRGREQGWMCLTLCSLDVTWTVTVVHWLTVNSQEVEDDIRSYHGNNPKLQPCAIGDNVDLFKSTLKSAAEVEVVESASSATIMQPPQAYGTKSIHHDIVEQPLGSI